MKDKTRIALTYLLIFLFMMLYLPAFSYYVLGIPLSTSDLLLIFIVGGSIMAFVVWFTISSMKKQYGNDWMKVGTEEWVEENVTEHLKKEFERRCKSLKLRVFRAIGVILLVSTFVVPLITGNPLWMAILFILTFIVMLPVGNVATMRFPGYTRRSYWIFVVSMIMFCIAILYAAILYWPDFPRALDF